MKIALKNVLPNPFRDMDNYPINQQKILALKASIEDTEFWDNIVCRRVGDQVEIAYGHHRLHALREMYPANHQISLITKDLDDEHMLKIMAHENLEEWGHVSDIERETVRAVVQAYGDKRISLNKPSSKARGMRYAPTFCQAELAGQISSPYTASTVANFLQWEEKTVSYTLRALCLIEEGHLKEDQLKGLTHSAARTVVDETNRSVKQAENIVKQGEREARTATPEAQKIIKKESKRKAKAIVNKTASAVSDAIKKNKGAASAKQAAVDARVSVQPKEKELPEISKAASKLASTLENYLAPEKPMADKLDAIVKYRSHLDPVALNDMLMALKNLVEDAKGYIHQLSQ